MGDDANPPVRTTAAAADPEDAALAAIVRSSQDAVIAKTTAGVITAWNRGAEVLYGYAARDAVGSSIERMYPPADRDEERARHTRVAAGATESGYRCRRVRADGEVVDVVMSMLPVRDERGRITGVATISRPVSLDEQLAGRIGSILEAAPDGMLCVDRDGIIRMANSAAHLLFGHPAGGLVGLPVESLVPDPRRSVHAEHRMRYTAHPVRRPMGPDLPLAGRRADGSTFPVEISLATDGVGAGALTIAAVRDVTERHRMEAAVRTGEAHLRQLAEHVDTVFLLRQLQPRDYLYVSPAFERVTGWPVRALSEDPDFLSRVIHPDDREQVDHYFSRTMQGRAAHSEHRILRPDGAVRWVRLFAAPVPEPTGPVQRVVVTMEDVTDRVEAARSAQRSAAIARSANEAKTAFLSRMSHELRTPLNAILGFAQLLDRQSHDERAAPSIRHILQAGHHLHDLIGEVLDISRIESGDLTVDLTPVDPAAAVREALDLIAPMAAASAVTLHPPVPEVVGWLLADRQRLMQVLLNLLSNAVKYNHPAGHVWVGLHRDRDRVVIEIRDDGRGIPLEQQDRLFTPFDRLGAEASGIEGTGVGLAVTRGLVDVMGGALGFRSVHRAGSTFTVSFPSAPATPAAGRVVAAVPATSPPVSPAPSLVLLYIEDNEPNVRLVESLLALRPGWTLRHAGTAAAGVAAAAAGGVDLVLLDMHLPDGLGTDVLRELRSHEMTASLPVVMLSADASQGLADRTMAAGAWSFMTKPLDIDAVLDLLDRVGAGRVLGPDRA